MPGMLLSRWLLCSTLGLTAGLDDSKSDQGDLASAIRTAYEANRSAFRFGTLKLRDSIGIARDAESANRRDWTRKYGEAEGVYVFDGTRAMYDCTYPLEDMVASRVRSGDGWTSVLSHERGTTDGKLTLLDAVFPTDDGKSLTHTAEIFPASLILQRQVAGA